MKIYAQALREFQLGYFLHAVDEARGSFNKAAELAGVHRNTVTRFLKPAGYGCKRARALLRLQAQRKPPQREVLIAYGKPAAYRKSA